MITSNSAIEIARRVIAGKCELQKDSSVSVSRTGDQLIVVFEHRNDPGVRGASYDAKVTIDAATGKILEILAGP